jgi:hypothetical protein
MKHILASHFDAYRQRGKWSFFWRVTFEGLAVSLVAAIVTDAITEEAGGRPHLENLSTTKLFAFACIWAPLLETVFLQGIPVMVARRWRARFWTQVVASAVPFAAMHLVEGIGIGIAAGAVGGLYLGFTYVHWREESLTSAFLMTAGTHALRNGIAVAFLVTSSSLFPIDKRPAMPENPERYVGYIVQRRRELGSPEIVLPSGETPPTC